MRIAVLTNSYLPDQGGSARVAGTQVELLKAAGHDVRVWCPPVRWFAHPVPVRLIRHLLDLGARTDLTDEIIAWKPEILITHNLTGCGFGTPSVIQKSGVRWVHVLHDVQLFEPSGKVRDARPITSWQRLWTRLRRLHFGEPNLVISPTEWLVKEHRRRGWLTNPLTHVSVLLNPSQSIDRTIVRPAAPSHFLFVGRLSADKGTSVIEQLVAAFPDSKWDLIGDGPERERLSRLSPRVTVHGKLETAAVIDQMRKSDVLIMPSQISENQPTVLIEAASQGLPAIASDIGGVRETLVGTGTLCPPNDLEAWKSAIQSISEPKQYAEAVGRAYELSALHQPDRYGAALIGLLTR